MRRFSVDEYHQMIRAAILTEDDAVELLEGWIVPKMPRNPLHDATVQRIDELLTPQLPSGWSRRIQSAITLADSEPEPDFAVVKGMSATFVDHHPGPGEIGIVIEVSESTLANDQSEKLRTYARAGLPEYWIVNLVDRQIEVYSAPTGPSGLPEYRRIDRYRPGASVPVAIGTASFALCVDDIVSIRPL